MAKEQETLVTERLDLTEELDGVTLDTAIERLSALRERHGAARIDIAAYEIHGEPHPRFAVEVQRPETAGEAALRREREIRHEERLRNHYEQLRARFEPGQGSRRSSR